MQNIIAYLQDRESENRVVELIAANIHSYQALNTDGKVGHFTGALYNLFVGECVRNNQYLALSKREFMAIHRLYRDLILSLKETAMPGLSGDDAEPPQERAIRDIVQAHRKRLIGIIAAVDDAAHHQILVPCAEYTPGLQMAVLRIDGVLLAEPILDIGCGKDCALVRSLLKDYLNVYGLDQYDNPEGHILCDNWLDFHYETDGWGTVISHMAFTNHFRRSLALGTGDRARYEKKYREILRSLKTGGLFIYTPAVPEIERTLDPARFEVLSFRNIPDNPWMDTVHIRRRW